MPALEDARVSTTDDRLGTESDRVERAIGGLVSGSMSVSDPSLAARTTVTIRAPAGTAARIGRPRASRRNSLETSPAPRSGIGSTGPRPDCPDRLRRSDRDRRGRRRADCAPNARRESSGPPPRRRRRPDRPDHADRVRIYIRYGGHARHELRSPFAVAARWRRHVAALAPVARRRHR